MVLTRLTDCTENWKARIVIRQPVISRMETSFSDSEQGEEEEEDTAIEVEPTPVEVCMAPWDTSAKRSTLLASASHCSQDIRSSGHAL